MQPNGKRLGPSNGNSKGPSAPALRCVIEDLRRYRAEFRPEVLVPVPLDPFHSDGLAMVLQLAAAYFPHPVVDLLHVLSPDEEPHSAHWLDAIEKLHGAFSHPRSRSADRIEMAQVELARRIEDAVPLHLRRSLELRCVCRMGDPATEIARIANERAVDAVMLRKRRSRWRWPFRPSLTRRVMALTTRPVILVQPPVPAAKSSLPG